MRLDEIDENLKIETTITEPDLVWLNVRQEPFSVHGVLYDKDQKCFVRMPQAVADSVSRGVADLNHCTAGGRVRFKTNSSFIGIRAVQKNREPSSHMSRLGQSGLDLYRKNEAGTEIFVNAFRPPMDMTDGYSSSQKTDGEMAEYTIHLPLYDNLQELYIALKKDAVLEAPAPYAIEKPVVYYGSSITQGGCAGRPGNSYQAMLSRRLKIDHINLGFSGQGRGEPQMAEYLAEICKNASAFVCNYDWNAPTEEHLIKTHMPLYRTVRAANPDLPILFMSEPEIVFYPQRMLPRLEIIRKTYETAKAEGDGKVWFLPGNTIYRGEHWDTCTVDACHPNDLGFFRMAMAIEPYLKEMLGLN